MTQSIIPGCEANPDPATVINVDPTKPMKEISMGEDAFDTLLVSAANAADRGRKLDEISQEQSLRIKELFDENEKLRNERSKLFAEYQELKDFKENYDSLCDDFGVGHALSDIEGKMNLLVYDEDILEKHGIADREELDERLENSGKATLRSALNTIGFNVSVVAKGWRMSASNGQEMLVKLVDNPLLDNNIAKLDCEASPDITSGSLCLSDIRIVIYV